MLFNPHYYVVIMWMKSRGIGATAAIFCFTLPSSRHKVIDRPCSLGIRYAPASYILFCGYNVV